MYDETNDGKFLICWSIDFIENSIKSIKANIITYILYKQIDWDV